MKILILALFRTALCIMLSTSARSQLIGTGNCPDRQVVQDFYPFKYLGVWYEYARYTNIKELGMICIESDYTLNTGEKTELHSNDNRQNVEEETDEFYPIIIQSSAITDILGFKYNKSYTAEARLDTDNNAGELAVNFGDGDEPYWVLSTDYETYALVWSCRNILDAFHSEYAWVLTRDPSPPEEVVSNISNVVKANNISTLWMTLTQQTNC